MGGEATKLGPFTGGLHNSSGTGEFIEDNELYDLVNMELDIDGSLVNRPEIKMLNVTGAVTTGMSYLGIYLPSDGRKYIVAFLPNAAGGSVVSLIDATTGAVTQSSSVLTSVCCIQYANKLWVVPGNDSPGNGGYFNAPTASTLTWTVVPTMPKGEAVVQYRERLWIACGIGAINNTSRFWFSAVGTPETAWNTGTDFIDCSPGNGQKLVSLAKLGQDIVLFKEHSTHKFTYTTDPRKAELNEIDAYIGVPAINCHVVYQNQTIYVMHDNSVYEMFQYTYTRISNPVNMIQESDLDLFLKDQYGLTLHRDRLFVRYFKNLYVYGLKVKKWARWDTTRKFSKVVVIPSATVGLDTAYAASASQAKPSEAYYFQDDRRTSDTGTPVAGVEQFKGTLTTKTYDFDIPHSYKAIFWWGVTVATTGKITASLVIPSASPNKTYQDIRTQYGTWTAAQTALVQWANNTPVTVNDIILPTLGKYARKFSKLLKKVRFRQVYFTLVFDIITNGGIADASLRVYDLTIFLAKKETVVKKTT